MKRATQIINKDEFKMNRRATTSTKLKLKKGIKQKVERRATTVACTNTLRAPGAREATPGHGAGPPGCTAAGTQGAGARGGVEPQGPPGGAHDGGRGYRGARRSRAAGGAQRGQWPPGGRWGQGPPGGARDGSRGCTGRKKGKGEERERERGGELTSGIQIPVITVSKT
jgi:hypothetical protein